MKSLFLSALLALVSLNVAADALIAVASNFSQCFNTLKTEFEKDSSHTVLASFGSSAALFAQIRHGAPFDAFLSADRDKPTRLIERGLAIEKSQYSYAYGDLVLWSISFPINDQSLRQVLQNASVKKIAMAKPQLAPYGTAAEQVLVRLNVIDQLRPQLVYGENITQAFQFVRSKNAQLGFIAKAQQRSLNLPVSHTMEVPTHLYSAIRQDAVLLSRGAQNATAIAFLASMRSKQGIETIKQCGYRRPIDGGIL